MSTPARPRPDVLAAIDRSAAPAPVHATIGRLLESDPTLDEALVRDARLAQGLVAVVAASRSLGRFLETHPDALGVLGALDRREVRDDTTVERLVRWKQRELLRIAARDLVGLDRLEETGAALSALAADVLEGASLITGARGLAIIGMGKLGGWELNYASDVDVIFVGDGPPDELERDARAVTDVARRCFRVDANLRPQGRDGPLVRTIDSYEAYWDRWAEAWEFQALLKVRPVAGDMKLGAVFDDTAQRWLWSHPFDAEDLRSLRQMKRRAETEVARRGLADREIKRGRGGIRDIEFTAQLLQLVHGHSDADIRSPNTLTVLAEMARAGYIDRDDADRLAEAYRFLRVVEHRLQLVDEQQVHTVPTEPAALDRLARVVGYRDDARASATEQLEHNLLHHQLAVRSIHERVYFRPLLEAFAGTSGALSPEAAGARLAAFGFSDAKRTQTAVRELTRGLNRSSRLMQQLLPLMLDWLSTAPDPDLGLLVLRNLLSGSQRTVQLVEAFRDSPEAAQHLCTIVGTSRFVGDILVHNPDLVARLPDTAQLRTRPRDELVDSATAAVSWRTEQPEQQVALRRWRDRHLLGITARDILGFSDVERVGADLAALAEATVETALRALEPRIPFCVLALGRLGGSELSYASDLDVVFVYGGEAPGRAATESSTVAAADEALRVASGLLRFVGAATPAGQIYPIDAQLRPEGKQGPLARTIDGFVHYWERYALVWERQAMIRARPVAGDLALGEDLLDALAPFVWDRPFGEDDVREVRRMKARIERERIPFGEDPQFHLKLGRGSLSDIEFTVQLLQLRHGVREPGTMRALDALVATDALDSDDAEILAESYRFCERARNRWFLVNSKPGNSLPTQPEPLTWLARSLDMTPSDLREHYRRVTRRARRVVERVFYGRGTTLR